MTQPEEYRPIAHEYFVDKTFAISNFGNLKNTKTGNVRATCPKAEFNLIVQQFY